jgi:cation/acetate symporter
MALSFACGIVFSYLYPEKEAEQMFEDEKLRTYLGVGAE